MSDDVRKVTVEILGERYTIRGSTDPVYIGEVAGLVDGRMRDLYASNRNLSRSRLAVLTALNLADELLQERNRNYDNAPSEEVIRRTKQLISLLDEGLIGDVYAGKPHAP